MNNSQLDYKKKWFEYLGYQPHNGQLPLHYPEKKDARFQVVVCGRRFGKTWASAMEATYVASQPNKRIWVVGMSYKKARLIFREISPNFPLALKTKFSNLQVVSAGILTLFLAILDIN